MDSLENESNEESLDSIPPPEYEAIDGSSTKSTCITPVQQDAGEAMSTDAVVPAGVTEVVEIKSNEILLNAATPTTLTVNCATEEVDTDNDADAACDGERDGEIEDETQWSTIIGAEMPLHVEIAPTAANVAAMTATTITTPAATALTTVGAIKMLPVKTKDNKLFMVQLVDETGKATLTAAASTAVAVATTAITTAAPILQTVELNSPPEDKFQQQQQQRTPRSSTPMSREFLALQRSVIDSKVLSEMITEIKPRKLRKSGANTAGFIAASAASTGNANMKRHLTGDESLMKLNMQRRKSSIGVSSDEQLLMHSYDSSLGPPSTPNSTEKARKSSKYAPLKDNSINSSSSSDMTSDFANPTRRSRSKSVHRKSPVAALDASASKLRKWPSDEKILKRTNMRSQNSEFVQKQLDFLNRVTRDEHDASDVEYDEQYADELAADEDDSNVAADASMNDSQLGYLGNFNVVTQSLAAAAAAATVTTVAPSSGDSSVGMQVMPESANTVDSMEARLKSIWQPPPKRGWDSFCWKCRECVDLIPCSKCVRCFHTTCIKITFATKLDSSWTCPECLAIEHVLNGPKRTRRNELSLDLLSQLLSFALKRMKNVKGVSQPHFKYLLATEQLSTYSKYIVNPVTFATLQEKIEKKHFRCAEEFVNETKWMQHNALILTIGTPNSKETLTAKAILKICRQEANEIDTCAECYLNANTRTDWFVDVCAQPHLLLWAKLKGFPYWPAKAMGLGQGSHVNVRFFGEHDRAFVPVKDCFLYSEQDPNTQTGKRSARELADCIKEVEVHIEKIKAKIGDFRYAKFKMPYDPAEELQQLEYMMPGVIEYMKRQQTLVPKQSLQYKIVKTADNNLSIIKKASTTESGNDSDYSSSPGKKKLLESETMDANNKSKLTTTKYEVITKTTSDESNSSKVSTVILKRKSDGDECKKNDDIELPLPKITKIEDCSDEDQRLMLANTSVGKRKHHAGTDGTSKKDGEHGEKPPKAKHAKHEPRVPLLTIKTHPNAKIVETKESRDDSAANATQATVEQLVKHKQGVTIKKITKEATKSTATATGNATATAMPCELQETEKATEMNKQNVNEVTQAANVKEKDVASQIVTAPAATATSEAAITTQATTAAATEQTNAKKTCASTTASTSTTTNSLKGLVPFVEIKKEVTSDDDEANAKPNTSNVKPNLNLTNNNVAALTATATATQIAALQAPLLLAPIKQEVMSDEEESMPTNSNETAAHLNNAALPINKANEKTAAIAAANANSTANTNALHLPNDAVRVVGDTTIQRISTKSNNNNASSTVSTQAIIAPTMSAGKRTTTRGVPYGPLPASAMSNLKCSATVLHNANATNAVAVNAQQQQQQQQQQLRQNQRARKSFPTRSPSEVNLACYNNNNNSMSTSLTAATTTTSLAAATLQSSLEATKRSLLKTSMVSIPVDVATNRNNNNTALTVPVPPLTAVSKTTPAIAAANALLTPAAVAAVVSTASATFAHCNGTTTASATPTTTATSAALLTPYSMSSVPPPLAGLSQSSTNFMPAAYAGASTTNSIGCMVSSAATLAGATATTTAAAIAATNTLVYSNGLSADSLQPLNASSVVSANATDGHLLGDLVTPTLASAITEIICRGPPKITVRPNGPLQSDGGGMFPSQAGPVCRTLVENAHKLTDFFISVMEDTMCEMSAGEEPVLQAKITLLTLELERMKQAYEHEMAELKRTSDLMLCEMRKSMENEKKRITNEVRKQCELERLRSIDETKRKQWCANCGREAQFYCCWNTSYCDYPCQQLHWSRHAVNCAQTRPSSNEGEAAAAAAAMANKLSITAAATPTAATASTTTTITTTSTHYNKTVISNNKKDKHAAKQAAAVGLQQQQQQATPSAEMLKLPSNTYLRPVTATATATTNSGSSNNNNNSAVRAAQYALPVQRFQIPLPITAPVNTPPPYTIVQRGSSWEFMSTATQAQQVGSNTSNNNNSNSSSNVNVNATSAIAASVTPATQQQQQMRLVSHALSGKSSARSRAAAAAAANMQQQCGAVLRSTQM